MFGKRIKSVAASTFLLGGIAVMPVQSADVRYSTAIAFDSHYNLKSSERLANGVDQQGLSMARASLESTVLAHWQSGVRFNGQIQGFYDSVYDLRDNHNAELVDTYQSELELGEFYISVPINDDIQLSTGRQIDTWGHLDFLRVVDTVNPLDLRSPGSVDLEDTRLPVWMTQADALFDNWRFSAAIVHEFRKDKTVPYGSAYYGLPVAPPSSEDNQILADQPGITARISHAFSRADLSLYVSRLPRSDGRVSDPLTDPTLIYEHRNQIGAALQTHWDNWVFKSEINHVNGLHFANTEAPKNQTLYGLGLEYQGINDLLVSLEGQHQKTHDFEDIQKQLPDLAVEKNTQLALFVQWDISPDVWKLESLSLWSQHYGSFTRMNITHIFSDHFSASLGFIDYQNGDNLIASSLDVNDKWLLNLEWDY